jgi:hypothetical protein
MKIPEPNDSSLQKDGFQSTLSFFNIVVSARIDLSKYLLPSS